jgi:hypothetical protein
MSMERTLPIAERQGAPGGGTSIFDEPDAPGMATVSTGLYSEFLPVANSTIGEIRARFRDRLQIPPNSQAILDGVAVDDDVRIRNGQLLRFQHTAGEKGQH